MTNVELLVSDNNTGDHLTVQKLNYWYYIAILETI